MSKTQAAYEILLASRKPMNVKKIVEIAIAKKMIVTSGLTPDATLRTEITAENKRRESRGEQPRFVKVGPGIWTVATLMQKKQK